MSQVFLVARLAEAPQAPSAGLSMLFRIVNSLNPLASFRLSIPIRGRVSIRFLRFKSGFCLRLT